MVENPMNVIQKMGMHTHFGLPLPMLNAPAQTNSFSYVGSGNNFSSRVQGQVT